MAISLVTAIYGGGGGPPPGVAFTSTVPIGDVIVAQYLSAVAGNPGALTVSDNINPGNYTPLITQFDATTNLSQGIFFKRATVAGTPTVTLTQGTSQFGNVAISQWTGWAGVPTSDSTVNHAYFNDVATTSLVCSPIVTSANNELMLALWKTPGGVNFTSMPSGWTQILSAPLAYAIVPTSGTSIPFSGTLNSSDQWDALVAGIYDAPFVPPTTFYLESNEYF